MGGKRNYFWKNASFVSLQLNVLRNLLFIHLFLTSHWPILKNCASLPNKKKMIQKLKCFFFLSLCLMCVQQEDSKERRTMKSTHHDVTGVWRYRRPLAVHHRESVNRRDDRITKPRKNSHPAAALFFVQKAGDVTVDIGGYKSLPIQREESSKEPRNGSLIAVQPQRKENKRRTERSERKR